MNAEDEKYSKILIRNNKGRDHLQDNFISCVLLCNESHKLILHPEVADVEDERCRVCLRKY
jgi:hypothetical protein